MSWSAGRQPSPPGTASVTPACPTGRSVIGDGCVLGARITITAHQYVELGDSVFTGQSVFITDASHGYQDPETPIGKQFGAHQPVVIGPRAPGSGTAW